MSCSRAPSIKARAEAMPRVRGRHQAIDYIQAGMLLRGMLAP